MNITNSKKNNMNEYNVKIDSPIIKWPILNSLDVFLHDSKHTYEHMTWEYKTIWPYLNSNGVWIADKPNGINDFKDFFIRRKLSF